MACFDTFNFQYFISPRPLLMIVGSKEHTLHYSQEPVKVVEKPKELFTIEGKKYFNLYNDLTKSSPKVIEFFGKSP
jgi:uncharacterized protein